MILIACCDLLLWFLDLRLELLHSRLIGSIRFRLFSLAFGEIGDVLLVCGVCLRHLLYFIQKHCVQFVIPNGLNLASFAAGPPSRGKPQPLPRRLAVLDRLGAVSIGLLVMERRVAIHRWGRPCRECLPCTAARTTRSRAVRCCRLGG